MAVDRLTTCAPLSCGWLSHPRLQRRDPHDSYGHSVSLEVALCRKSRVPSQWDVSSAT